MPRRKTDCVPDKGEMKHIKLDNKNDRQSNSRNSAQMTHLNNCQKLTPLPNRVNELDANQKALLPCSSNVNRRTLPIHDDIHSSNRNIMISSSKSSSNRMIQIDPNMRKTSPFTSFVNCKPLVSNTKNNINLSNRKINMSNSSKLPSNRIIQLDANQEITLPCSSILNYKPSSGIRNGIHLLNRETNINSSKLSSNRMIKLEKKNTSSCSSFLTSKPSLFSRKNQTHSLNHNIITDPPKLPSHRMIQIDSNKEITIENLSNVSDQSSILHVKSNVRSTNLNKSINLPILSSNRIIHLDAPQKILLPTKSLNINYMPLLPPTNKQNTEFSMKNSIVTNLIPSSNRIIQLDTYQDIKLTKNEVVFTENRNIQPMSHSKNHISCPAIKSVMLVNDSNREQDVTVDRSPFCCDNETINIESDSTTNDMIPQIILDPILESSQNNLALSENTNVQNNFVTYPTIDIFDENSINEHYIGTMNILCEHCDARHFASERVSHKDNSFNDCCSHGKVELEDLKSPPSVIKELFDGTNEKSSHFYKRIRAYNNSFSFASFSANLVNFNNRRPGPYCFKIQGQIYYQINTSLYPAVNEYPSYGQLFFIDSNEAAHFRCERNSQLDKNILKSIDDTLRKHNEFAKSYQMMHEELQLSKMINNGTEPELQLLFSLKPGMDKNRFNFQRTNEVAAIFTTTADGEIPESYVTIRVKGTKKLQRISTMDPNVEPWIYPLFYPYGTRGWHRDLKCKNNCNRRVTRLAYVKYRIAIRDNFNVFLMGRRLFQQWIVDNYVKIEKDRIEYVKSNQIKFRTDSYQGLIDYLEKKANNQNSHIGKMVILPSTFNGSPRNMLQLYQDSMALVRKYGKPDLFITMTCNPNWREISENLSEGQTASDRPDIVARVFELKKDQLLDYILKKKLFGEVVAYVYVIEFQKRGLPHIHLLVTLKQNNKITTPDVVDKYICAEIPDPDTNPKLHKIVMKNMIHGPCGGWCLVNGKCSKNYPKKFQNETTMDGNGYPNYRRRNTGKIYTRLNTHDVDNTNRPLSTYTS